jgi:hypothetical protein
MYCNMNESDIICMKLVGPPEKAPHSTLASVSMTFYGIPCRENLARGATLLRASVLYKAARVAGFTVSISIVGY